MSDKEQTVPVYVDFLPSHAGHPAGRDTIIAHHRQWLESNLDAIITRQAQLPIFMLRNTSESVRLVVDLLVEARTLFCFGHHYSCVAMCGIVAERIIKDVLRNNVLTIAKSRVARPPEKAFDQLNVLISAASSTLLPNATCLQTTSSRPPRNSATCAIDMPTLAARIQKPTR